MNFKITTGDPKEAEFLNSVKIDDPFYLVTDIVGTIVFDYLGNAVIPRENLQKLQDEILSIRVRIAEANDKKNLYTRALLRAKD